MVAISPTAPNRIILAFLAMILGLVLCQSIILSASAQRAESLTADEKAALLRAHNTTRAAKQLSALTWDETLASFASEWAKQLSADSCTMRHRPSSGSYAQKYGENIFWSSPLRYADGRRDVVKISGTQVAQAWADEEMYYNYESHSCTPGQMCGHYTQMVWEDTARIGCGKAICDDSGQIWVCNYDPRGNYIGERPYADEIETETEEKPIKAAKVPM